MSLYLLTEAIEPVPYPHDPDTLAPISGPLTLLPGPVESAYMRKVLGDVGFVRAVESGVLEPIP